ncbi:MAG: hypothetical protein AABY68_11690 [Pseudomonadota bacterium]
MTQIDVAQLSRGQASLTKLKEPTTSTAHTGIASTALQRGKASTARDPAILKSRISERLKMLKKSSTDFAKAAPIVTVQEILRWQFGEDIFLHPDFDRIVGNIAAMMLNDETLKASLTKVIHCTSPARIIPPKQ